MKLRSPDESLDGDNAPSWINLTRLGGGIDYRNEHSLLHRVEVRGAFSAIDLTANELRAAQQHGSEYWIFLVANCLTDHPRIERICAPSDKLAAGAWVATPAVNSALG